MRAQRRGFTLVELMIVVTIIGILLTFILRAYTGSLRAAERAATIALIAKLEAALTDRLDALTSLHADPTWCHNWLGGIWRTPPGPGHLVPDMPGNQRAQVIAQYDYLRAELPDVFVLEPADPNYKINFGALPFSPTGGALLGDWRDYSVPLGGGFADPATGSLVAATGVKGASFAAAAAIYKQLGFAQKGLDGADNDGDGLIDEWDEGTTAATAPDILAKLGNHKHKTARAEMLYAILVEGTGPLGSVFTRDDFGPAEVKDTDGDGLMEFVDAWGEPLQFYRWPIMARSDTQKGFPDLAKIKRDLAAGLPIGPYATVTEPRELDPLDPNQQLLAPGWWGSFNSSYPWGSPRSTFERLFHTIVDPLAVEGKAPSNATYWDRSTDVTRGFFTRRSYYSRFLVVSGGPDKRPGTAQLGVNYASAYPQPPSTVPAGLDERSPIPLPDGSFVPYTAHDDTGAPVPVTILNVVTIENQGAAIDPNRLASGCPKMPSGRNDTSTFLEELAQDDLTSQNLHAAGTLPTSP